MNASPTPSLQHGETRPPSLYGAAVEYAIHCLVWLVTPRPHPASSRDLAELQGVSPAMMAKLMPRLERAGIVAATSGVHGGYRLARPPEATSILDIVNAVDGDKRLFDCKEIRQNCVLFGGNAPAWSGRGVCGIHAIMLRAENSMRAEIARTSLRDLANAYKAPAEFFDDVGQWLDGRVAAREHARITAVTSSARRRIKKPAAAKRGD